MDKFNCRSQVESWTECVIIGRRTSKITAGKIQIAQDNARERRIGMGKRTGIIGAMEEEVSQLKEKMENISRTVRAGMEFLEGAIGGQSVIVVRSGIGKVNAAVCTQILCGEFHADRIINTGIAGSLDADIDIGDIVISLESVQHDVDATGFGYAPGIIPRMETSVFPADGALAELAAGICREVNPDIRVFSGRVVSGDQFISDKAKKDWIKKNFGGLCVEMEGASIAQAAWLNGVPYLVIRAISDKADDSAQMAYDEFEAQAIRHTVALMTGLLARLD